MSEEEEYRRQVLLAFYLALWDMVTPDLRCITLCIAEDRSVRARWVYEGGPAELQLEIIDDCLTEFYAQFQEMDAEFHREVCGMDQTPRLERGEEWVYRRREFEDD